MKKFKFLFISFFIMFSFAHSTYANVEDETNTDRKSNVGITFKEGTTTSSTNYKEEKPNEIVDGNSGGVLPKTGELIGSVVIVLIGVALVIFLLATIVIQKIKQIRLRRN